jgi:glycosyltransferase involved in cell wall biosynthesis
MEVRNYAIPQSAQDLVSVIMPAYNCSGFIRETLESVVKQTYTNWEVIVVDDFSTDNTAQIIEAYSKQEPRIRYYRLETNSGAAIARNKGVSMADGKYIAFLDSDDTWYPEKLEKQIAYMKKNEYNFTCTSYDKIDERGKPINKITKARLKSGYDNVLKNCPGNSTVVYNAEALGKFYIEPIKKRNDYVMWLKVIKKAEYLYGIEEPLASYRIRNGSLSRNKISLIQYHWFVYREIEQLNVLKSTYLILYLTIGKIFQLR